MRWRRTELARVALALVAIGAATACVIGPKQDDPAAPGVNLATDASTDTEGEYASDTGGGLTAAPDASSQDQGDADAAAPPAQDTGCVGDAGDAGCADASRDAASDTLADAPEGG